MENDFEKMKAALILKRAQKQIQDDPLSIRDGTFPEQDRFVCDSSQRLAALCTRRAGKTNALALRFIRAMKRYPGATCRYIALTRDSAKEIMWPVLHEVNDRFKLGATFYEGNLSMELPNGGRLRLFGADMKNFIRRLKGVKSPAIAIDEAQDFGPHIEELIDDVLEPSLADYKDSWLALTGTPGPIPRGIFYEITEHGFADYSVHKWSLYQNPYMPNPKGFVEKLKKNKGWDDRHPTLLREYGGQWVLDLESLLVRYKPETNHYDHLPPGQYQYIMGIDLGFRDADAIAIIAWSESSKTCYLVEEVIMQKQGLTELVTQIETQRKKYEVAKLMIDEGGLGKKLAEEMRRRHHIPVQPADKARKMEACAFMNDALRQGLFKANKDSRFAQDSYRVQIDWEKSTPSRIVVKSAFHSDIIDAVLYAWRESPAYAYQAPAEKKPSVQQGFEPTCAMEEAAYDHLMEQEQAQREADEWGF